jgi:hypothetical protein
MNAIDNTARTPSESLSESSERPRLASLLSQWRPEQDTFGRLIGWFDRASEPRRHQMDDEMGDCLVRRGRFEDQIVATRATDVAQVIAKLEISIGNARDQAAPGGHLDDAWLMVESALADLSALAAQAAPLAAT